VDPVAEVRALVELLGQSIEDMAEIEERTKHDGVKIAAIRSKVETAFTRFELLQAMGWVPPPQVIQWEREMQAVIARMVDVLERHAVPDEALRELLAIGEAQLGRRQEPMGAGAA
jgi:hypothetical protein